MVRPIWIALLAGAPLGLALVTHSPPSERKAAERAVPLLQHSARTWSQKAACFSCHHQGLGQVSLAIARANGVRIDQAKLRAEVDEYENRDRYRLPMYEGTGAINGVAGFGFWLWGRSANAKAPDALSDAAAHYLLGKQAANGMWPSHSHRPPLEDSPVTLTAVAIRGLRLYSPPYLKSDRDLATQRARNWLMRRQPRSMEEAAFRVLGLVWSGATSQAVQGAKSHLYSLQKPDGGWSQLRTRSSDAYATGQAIVALALAGDRTSAASKRGIAFLKRSQEANGVWRVVTRRKSPGLKYLETGFPYREHQFISYAGTAWAVAALASHQAGNLPGFTLDPIRRTASKSIPLAESAMDSRLFEATLKGTLAEMNRAVLRGAKVNSTNEAGATPLMYAVRDVAKVKWLLARGADPNVTSKRGSTALLLASDTNGALAAGMMPVLAPTMP